LATALVVAVAALASTAAAYIGVLPEPLQRVAHVTVGAPAPTVKPPHQSKDRRSSKRHRQAPLLGTPAPTHSRASSAPAGHRRPRRSRESGALNCRPWQYQLPPGWAPPDPAWASGQRNVRCPGLGAHATAAPTPTSPASPGTHNSTSGGGSPTQQVNPSPSPSAGSSPGSRT